MMMYVFTHAHSTQQHHTSTWPWRKIDDMCLKHHVDEAEVIEEDVAANNSAVEEDDDVDVGALIYRDRGIMLLSASFIHINGSDT